MGILCFTRCPSFPDSAMDLPRVAWVPDVGQPESWDQVQVYVLIVPVALAFHVGPTEVHEDCSLVDLDDAVLEPGADEELVHLDVEDELGLEWFGQVLEHNKM